jgi:hypothetical protein
VTLQKRQLVVNPGDPPAVERARLRWRDHETLSLASRPLGDRLPVAPLAICGGGILKSAPGVWR